MVKSKLAMLRGRGVTWLGVRGFSRLGREKFDAKRKREFRIVRGIFYSKKSADTWSHFLRFKCASHLALCGRCDEVCWETLQDRSFFDRDLLSAADVHSLLTPFSHLDLPEHAWAHLRLECQTAASCSWGWLFGRDDLGV